MGALSSLKRRLRLPSNIVGLGPRRIGIRVPAGFALTTARNPSTGNYEPVMARNPVTGNYEPVVLRVAA